MDAYSKCPFLWSAFPLFFANLVFLMIKKLSLFTCLMLLIPVMIWISGWHWTLNTLIGMFSVSEIAVHFTNSASSPYALITCVIFMLWIMFLTRKRYSLLLVGFICAGSVIGTQVIKESAKAVFKEPRPFVEQIQQSGLLPQSGFAENNFYVLSKQQQAEITEKTALSVPDALPAVDHQAGELGYSFPSGHTIFAVSWLLLFAGFLFRISGQAVIFTQLFAIFWAAGILATRLYLGMHFPIDLFVSTLIAWAFHLVVFVWTIPYLETWNFFKKRN